MFCHEYLSDLNTTQAAIRAGCSDKTANVKSSRLLKVSMSKFRHLKSKLNEKAERLAKLEAEQLADEVEMDLGIG